MSINAVVWTNGDLVTQTKMQGMSDDATNITDNIHPQYFPFYFDQTFRHQLFDDGGNVGASYQKRNRVALGQTGIKHQIIDISDANVDPMVFYPANFTFLVMEGMTGNNLELKLDVKVSQVTPDGAVSIQVVDENAVLISNQEFLNDTFGLTFADAGFVNVSLSGITAGTHVNVDLGFNLNNASNNKTEIENIKFSII